MARTCWRHAFSVAHTFPVGGCGMVRSVSEASLLVPGPAAAYSRNSVGNISPSKLSMVRIIRVRKSVPDSYSSAFSLPPRTFQDRCELSNPVIDAAYFEQPPCLLASEGASFFSDRGRFTGDDRVRFADPCLAHQPQKTFPWNVQQRHFGLTQRHKIWMSAFTFAPLDRLKQTASAAGTIWQPDNSDNCARPLTVER